MAARILAGLVLASLLAACASPVPAPIRTPVTGAPTLGEVRQDPEAFQGARVRWGGTIAAVHNRAKVTRVEVVARELAAQGRPARGDATPGRFMAEFPGFLEPAVYAEGRRLTVVGTIAGKVAREIGNYPYRFPVVAVEHQYLWPVAEPARARDYPPPWYYDPWYPYHSPHYPYW